MLQIISPSSVYAPDGRLEVSVSFSMDDMAGSFSIVQARDMQDAVMYAFPDLGMGADVSIMLDGHLAISGQVDRREGAGDAESYRITITGRSKTANLVDASATHKTGQWDKVKPTSVVKDIADPFGISVRIEKPDEETIKRFILRDGETAERAIRRVAREFGFVPFGDENGDLVIQEPGARGTGTAFVLGQNILSWTASMDMKLLHDKVIVKGQGVTDDHNYGRPATEVVAAVRDGTVRHHRPLVIPMWGDATPDRVRRRAWIEALRRQGESINVSLVVPGFVDPVRGDLYRPNVRHHVVIPIDGVDNILVAKSVEFSLTGDQARTTIELVHEQAFSDGKAASTSKAKGGKRLAKSSIGGSAQSSDCDARCWRDAYRAVEDMELDE